MKAVEGKGEIIRYVSLSLSLSLSLPFPTWDFFLLLYIPPRRVYLLAKKMEGKKENFFKGKEREKNDFS